MTASTSTLPRYLTGRWTISPVHSDVSFTVRHLGVSQVHGRFNQISGEIITADPVERSSASASTSRRSSSARTSRCGWTSTRSWPAEL
jgi:polyisoprenoid-binding protein YceI